jgi:predicted nucleic acid-binding Zn finger protein
MASVPHPVPSRISHHIAALFGHEDEHLLAWQRFCAQAAEALHAQHAGERLTKALALAQDGQVMLEDDGCATVTSGANHYTVHANGTCDCPDYAKRGAPCKHVLAVLIHVKAQALLAPSPSAAPQPPVPAPSASTAPTPAPTTRQATPRSSAAWDVHEAPVSSCFKIRVGALEWTHTMRARDDAELQTRLQAFLPTFRAITAALEALHAEREAAKAAPAARGEQAPAASTPEALQQAVAQAVQAVLTAQQAAPNGQANGTPPPAAPSTGPAPSGAAPDDQQTGFCSLHQVQMEQKRNERGTWYSHWLRGEQQHCKGRRNGRR